MLRNAKAIADEEDGRVGESSLEWAPVWDASAYWNTKIEECKDLSGNPSILGVVN